MTPTTVAYLRVSTLKQVQDGNGLDVQRARIEAWAQYACVGAPTFLSDEGKSGSTTENRPQFRKALQEALRAGKDGTLIVYKLDRLGRNALDVQETIAVLLDAGVRVVSVADGIDSSSGMGAALLKLLVGILATFGEMEKESIRSRLHDGKRRAVEAGRIASREAPYGFQRSQDPKSKELLPCEGEQALIRTMGELRGTGLSFAGVAQALTAQGARTRHGKTWSPIAVHRLLTGSRTPRKAKRTHRIERARKDILDAE